MFNENPVNYLQQDLPIQILYYTARDVCLNVSQSCVSSIRSGNFSVFCSRQIHIFQVNSIHFIGISKRSNLSLLMPQRILLRTTLVIQQADPSTGATGSILVLPRGN